MGCGDACPIFPGKRYEDWKLDDPAGQSIDAVRPIRDDIRTRVERLIADPCPRVAIVDGQQSSDGDARAGPARPAAAVP